MSQYDWPKKQPEKPWLTVFLHIFGSIGILLSAVMLLDTLSDRGIGAAIAIGGICSSLLVFAAGSALSRLTAVEFYLKAICDNTNAITQTTAPDGK